MKKVCALEDLDCANCAAKMTEGIRKIEGVKDADVNFMTQKMIIDIDDDKFDEVFKLVVKTAKKVEPAPKKAEPKVEKAVKDLKKNLSDFLQNLSDRLED